MDRERTQRAESRPQERRLITYRKRDPKGAGSKPQERPGNIQGEGRR